MNNPQPDQLELSQTGDIEEAQKIKGILEAILFASSEPITTGQFQFFLKETFLVTRKNVEDLLFQLKEEYDKSGRSFELVTQSEGYQLRTRSEYNESIKRFLKQATHEKLSKAALETLAIIAYKQPVTRAEIEKIRGVSVDGPMKILLEKDLIYPSGQRDVPGKPWLYSTTKTFLTVFNLKSLQELPPLGELNLN